MDERLILLLSGLTPAHVSEAARHGTVLQALDSESRSRSLQDHAAEIEIVVTNGFVGLTREEIERLPKLRLICCVGVGYEGIDVATAFQRGIGVSYGPQTNSDAVADHAWALALALVRRIGANDDAARRGIERNQLPVPEQIQGKKMGLFGFGDIGRRIARRALGFDVDVGYHARSAKPEFPHRYFANLVDLAAWSDILVLAAPGGPATARSVDREVLAALGPHGYLVNVARGSLIDENALADSLRERQIKGVALDVYDSEPSPPENLIGYPDLILSPHIAGRSIDSMRQMGALVLRNIDGYLSGRGLVTPVDGSSSMRGRGGSV